MNVDDARDRAQDVLNLVSSRKTLPGGQWDAVKVLLDALELAWDRRDFEDLFDVADEIEDLADGVRKAGKLLDEPVLAAPPEVTDRVPKLLERIGGREHDR